MPSIFITAASLLLAAAAAAAPTVSEKNQAALAGFERLRAGLYADDARLQRVFDAAAGFLRAAPARGPREAVRNVLLFMKSSMKYAPDRPVQRGPHEWTARQSLAYGTSNGCVEAAKVFFELFREAYPAFPALAIGSFNSACPDAGHAVVEVEDGDGSAFLVDASSFERMPGGLNAGWGPSRLSLEDVRRPVSFRPEVRGAVVQAFEDSDLFVEEKAGGYRAARYEYGQVFDGKLLEEVRFKTLDEVNAYLARFVKAEVSFEDLERTGLVLRYDGPDKAGFLYADPCRDGAKARYVVFACDAAPASKDGSEAVEPLARRQYEKTGRAETCVRKPIAPSARP
ncbi:MAG TPA: hypothetical protein DCM05_09670 [Elusimicrobia bacterium]|nr:hypothetical protein [Elusimicrobiota bacterium]